MKENKIAFILSVNNMQEVQECLRYINRLIIPDGYETDIITIQEADSMAEAYNAAMKSSDAHYKIYLHQDVFLIYRHLIHDMVEIFKSDEKIGLIGCIGTTSMPNTALPGTNWNSGRLLQNQVPQREEHEWTSKKLYQEVDAVDGLFLATQYDVNWREDIFDGWDYYDISHCYEMKRCGKKVVVPYQKRIWCYHDNLYSKMLHYDEYRIKFVQEYRDMGHFDIEETYNPVEVKKYEQMKLELMEEMKGLLDQGELRLLVDVFRIPQNKGYLFLREYEVIARIYEAERQAGESFSVWHEGASANETLWNLHELKFLLKAIEYQAEEEDTRLKLKEKYSKCAIEIVRKEYCIL